MIARFPLEAFWVYDEAGSFVGIETIQAGKNGDDDMASNVTEDHPCAHNQRLPRGLIRIPIPHLDHLVFSIPGRSSNVAATGTTKRNP